MTEITQARRKTIAPVPKAAKGQRSLDAVPPFLTRRVTRLRPPSRQDAETWRRFVKSQSVAILCKESIIDFVLNLDWAISPVDPNQRDELKGEIEYYTELFTYNGEYDFTGFVEWVLSDYLDLPFGAGVELIYERDNPDLRLLHYVPLDGGTLFPTGNPQWPIGQVIGLNQVYFPFYAINRIYMSPRTDYKLRGWGEAPPEKIFLAMEMLSKGDSYYANLLSDTPEAGLLDLGDMSQTSAEEWLEHFQELMAGIDPFKIPVLYEHNTQAKFISFGRPPTEMLFSDVTLRYAAIVCGGYGISLSDIGIQAVSNGGETLAGSIRQERRSRRSGQGKAKKKVKLFYDRMLPDSLKFQWVDPDEEQSVATGRAMLSISTAAQQLIDAKVFTQNEMRRQMVANGLITVPIPEDVPEDEFIEKEPQPDFNTQRRLIQDNVPPSQGGTGEVRSSRYFSSLLDQIYNPEYLFNAVNALEADNPDDLREQLDHLLQYEIDLSDIHRLSEAFLSDKLESLTTKIPFLTSLRQRGVIEQSDAILSQVGAFLLENLQILAQEAKKDAIELIVDRFSLDTVSGDSTIEILEDFNISKDRISKRFASVVKEIKNGAFG